MKPWKIDRDTKVLLSASSAPSNFGVTIYNELFRRRGVNAIYLARRATDAARLVAGLRALDIAGASVSMPLKHQILPHLDRLDPEAMAVQSVNTVLNIEGELIGHNTDLAGLRAVLSRLAPERVLVLGSGSVTDSVLQVLQERGATAFLRARNETEAAKKRDRWGVAGHRDQPFDLFINATPMSLGAIPAQLAAELEAARCRVFDMVVPQEGNRLLELCRERRLEYVPGFEMYQHQLMKQLQLYTGLGVEPAEIAEIAASSGLI